MPMAAVSVRETKRSDHSPYAAVSPQVRPRSAPVASASTRPSPDSMSTQHGLERHRGVVRRPAGGVEHLGDQRPPVGHGHLGRVLVPGDRLQPLPAFVELEGDRLLVRLDDAGDHAGGRPPRPRVLEPAGGVRALDELAQPGERRRVPAPRVERRLQPLGPDQGPRLHDLVARRDHDRALARRGERGPFAGARPVAEVRVELGGARAKPVGQLGRQPGQCGRRPTSWPADVAVRDAERPPHGPLVLHRGLLRGHQQQLAQLGRVEAGEQRHPQHQLALGQLQLGPRHQPDHLGPGHPALRVDDAAQRGGLLLAEHAGPGAPGGAARTGSGCSRSPPAAPTR